MQPLEELAKLATLDLGFCGRVKNLFRPGKLRSLVSLDLSGCAGIVFFASIRPLLAQLERLCLFGCRFKDLRASLRPVE